MKFEKKEIDDSTFIILIKKITFIITNSKNFDI